MTICTSVHTFLPNLMALLTLGAHAQRGLQYLVCKCVCLSVCPSVCYHVFCHHAQEIGETAIVTRSVLHWLGCAESSLSSACTDKSVFVRGHAELTELCYK